MLRRFLVYAGFGAAALAAMGVLAGIFYIYTVTRDLPSVEALQNYSPPVTTRVYAGNGTVLGEYARESRIFVPSEFIPKLVAQAFTSAEDRNFYSHPGIDPSGILRAAIKDVGLVLEGRRPPGRLHHHPAGGAQFPAEFGRQVQPQDPRSDPGDPHRRDLSQGQDSRTLSQRNLSRRAQLWRRRGGAELFRQVARRAGRHRSRLPGGAAQGPGQLRSALSITPPRWTGATG